MTILLIHFFSALLLICAIIVIVSKNPLYSVLFLVACFLSASVLLFLLENEFLALFFLIIYLGAIAILFLFVVMMLDIKYREMQTSRLYFPLGIFVGAILLMETWRSLSNVFLSADLSRKNNAWNSYVSWYDTSDALSDIVALGQIFYTQYVLQILIAGLILYAAVIATAFLTVKSAFSRKSRDQSVFRQLSRRNVL